MPGKSYLVVMSVAASMVGAGLLRAGEKPAVGKSAVAAIDPKGEGPVMGEATFTHKDGKVTLHVEIQGVAPGTHAVHLHEKGDCSAPDFTSAGEHWNPTKEDHGKWGAKPFHKGDIGNIEVGKDGRGTLDLTTDLWTIGDGGPGDVVGKAVIVHAAADDGKTQPSGAAGDRIGCGVVKLE